MENKIKIIIADDHKMFLEGLASLLNNFPEIEIIATVSNGEEVLKILNTHSVNVVVTDIDMPVMDGFKLTKEIKKNYPTINILALSMHNSGKVIANLLKQGVTGYILKDTGKEELIEAIKTVARGEPFFSGEVKSTLMNSMMPGRKTSSGGIFIELTEREKEVLKLIASGLTYQQIGEKLFISENTVIFHKKSLYEKLGVKNTAGLITGAIEKGLLD